MSGKFIFGPNKIIKLIVDQGFGLVKGVFMSDLNQGEVLAIEFVELSGHVSPCQEAIFGLLEVT